MRRQQPGNVFYMLFAVCLVVVMFSYTNLFWRLQSLEARVNAMTKEARVQSRALPPILTSVIEGEASLPLKKAGVDTTVKKEEKKKKRKRRSTDVPATEAAADDESSEDSEASVSEDSDESGVVVADADADLSFLGKDQIRLLSQFGVLTAQNFSKKVKRTSKTTRIHTPDTADRPHYFYGYLDNPARFSLLRNKKFKKGELAKPISQKNHEFFTQREKRYFEGYKYPSPHPCPGQPYECSAHGVCDTTRGVCTCIPPWTGWQCNLKMKTASTPQVPGRFTQDDCTDQVITAPAAEKWDERTEKRCRGDADSNGMWLGLTKKMTMIIAHSIVDTLGIEKGDKVLDIGMGCGTISEGVRDVVDAKLFGIDYSQAAIKYVREIMNGVFCVADVRDLSFIPDASIDFAFENGVFSVTRDKHCETYKDVIRILKPGGTLLIMQTYTDWHKVRCWQNIRMQSVEGCLADLGLRMDYVLTRDLTRGQYDSYCAGETYSFFLRKPL